MSVYTTALRPGDTARLLSFGWIDASYRRRLLSFGLTCGVMVTVIRRAPLGCPLQLDVRGTSLLVRQDEAACLEWELL